MKHQTLRLGAAIPALLAFAPVADDLTFAPQAGSSATKTFTSTTELSLDDMSVLIDGQPNPMMPELVMDMVITSSATVTDTYDAVAGGRPTKLTRYFDSASMELEMDMEATMMGETQSESATGSGESKLDGSTVIFTYDADTEEYTRAFPEGEEGDADLLENLAEDMDLRTLLPADGSLDEGDSYEIALGGLIHIFAPGGDLKLDVEMDGEEVQGAPDPQMMANMQRILEEMVEGEAKAKYVGTRDVDGVTVGVVELTFDIHAARDMSDMVDEIMGEQIPEGVDLGLDSLDVEFAYEGGGELLWNLGAHRAHSLTIEGDAEINVAMAMNIDMGGNSMSIEMEMAMSGSIANSVAVE